MTDLNAYMAHCGEPSEGAVLVFAHTAQEARKLAHPVISDWNDGGFISVRAKRLRKHLDWINSMRRSDKPHVIDDPFICPNCEKWGAPMRAGKCAFCADEEAA